MDCQSALDILGASLSQPKDMMGLDIDLVLSWQKLKEETHHTVKTKWVQGHASKKETDPANITPMERENEDCNAAANFFVGGDVSPLPFHPLPGY